MDSDDRKEFERILSEKLGEDAADLFTSLVTEDSDGAESLLSSAAQSCKSCIADLNATLATTELDRSMLEDILCRLQQLQIQFSHG